MDSEPIKGLYYVSIVGPAGEVRAFRREVSKLPEWGLYERDGVLHAAKRDAGPGDTARVADARGKRLVKNVSRALILGGQDPLSGLACGGSFCASDDGKKHYVMVTESLKVKVSVGAVVVRVGKADEPPPPDSTLKRLKALEALDGDDELQTALDLFEAEGDRWGTLYNILERVRAALGSDIPRDWISKAQLELLERTANHDQVGGLTARHHAAKTQPPADPMPLDVAREHVRRILDRLIERRALGAGESHNG